MNNTMVNISEVIGHYVETEISFNGYLGKVKTKGLGRIIYSEGNASLFFKPKGNRKRGYLIESESDIHTVKIIKKNKADNEYYINAYNNKEKFEHELLQREELQSKEYQERERLRKERFENQRQAEREEKQKQINEAKSLGGYEELEKEVIAYYESTGEYSESTVKTIFLPILNKLIHKSISNVDEYPKHYFGKSGNPRFCSLIEKYLNIKLPNTQKGSVDKLNKYLAS